MAALAGYYGLYEYGHWCMHNPGGRLIERTRVFRFSTLTIACTTKCGG
jgi:hypothetical protein